jgi:hypothetical protein
MQSGGMLHFWFTKAEEIEGKIERRKASFDARLEYASTLKLPMIDFEMLTVEKCLKVMAV